MSYRTIYWVEIERIQTKMDAINPPQLGNDWDGALHVRPQVDGTVLAFDTVGSVQISMDSLGEFAEELDALPDDCDQEEVWALVYKYQIAETSTW